MHYTFFNQIYFSWIIYIWYGLLIELFIITSAYLWNLLLSYQIIVTSKFPKWHLKVFICISNKNLHTRIVIPESFCFFFDSTDLGKDLKYLHTENKIVFLFSLFIIWLPWHKMWLSTLRFLHSKFIISKNSFRLPYLAKGFYLSLYSLL